MRPRLRQGPIAALALVAVVSTAAITVDTTALAAPADRAAAERVGTWLVSKLQDGRYPNPMGSGSDPGLMVDALFGLHAAGRGDLAAPVVHALDDEGAVHELISFSSWRGRPDPNRLGGATAKAVVAALVAGRDPRSFGGLDLVTELQGAITPSGPERGRVRDHGPDVRIDNANTFGQAFTVMGLGRLGDQRADVVAQLLRQQCSEGYFRIFYSVGADGNPATCDEGKARDRSAPDGDSTGIALSALLAARDTGTGGLDGPIARARAWLVAAQRPDGGWGGGVGTEAANTNSTGLVVQALADVGGAEDVVARGRAFLRSAQVGAADAGTDVGGELGAIAYQPAERVAARSAGIVGLDTWIRASAQAVLGLAEVGFDDLLAGRRPPPPTTPVPTTSVPTPPSTPPAPATSSPGASDPPVSTPRMPTTSGSPASPPGRAPRVETRPGVPRSTRPSSSTSTSAADPTGPPVDDAADRSSSSAAVRGRTVTAADPTKRTATASPSGASRRRWLLALLPGVGLLTFGLLVPRLRSSSSSSPERRSRP